MTIGEFQEPVSNVPAGLIVPWYGDGGSVPPGWVLCDGNNGTPNLEGRHPKCVPDSSTDPGGRGGAGSRSLSVSELPSHNHSSSTSNDGSHSHVFTTEDTTSLRSGGIFNSTLGGPNSITTSDSGSHSHSVNIGTTGGDGSYNNEPEYVIVNFIQKV